MTHHSMPKRFQDDRPELGQSVFVWIEGRWVPALLVDDPWQKGRPPEDRRNWSFLNGEERTVQPDDLWSDMKLPDPPQGTP